jgi:2-succinyl-6-hydroxy-2,4-cyclohexadiene-1-carboxylate synthase
LQSGEPTSWGDRRNLEPRKGPVARSFLQWSLGQQENLLPMLSRCSIPLLWLTGENDAKFTQLAGDTCKGLLGVNHEIFPHCGHRLPWDDVEMFSRRLLDFLEGIEP